MYFSSIKKQESFIVCFLSQERRSVENDERFELEQISVWLHYHLPLPISSAYHGACAYYRGSKSDGPEKK
jgi:hypothetical protein